MFVLFHKRKIDYYYALAQLVESMDHLSFIKILILAGEYNIQFMCATINFLV